MDTRPILITGASSGIGEATARRLAPRHTVYATARNIQSIQHLSTIGCQTLELDVTDQTSIDTAVATIGKRHGPIAVLVNNAGYSQSGAVESLTIEQVHRQFDTNVYGQFRLTKAVLPGMRSQRHGRIINVSSMGGRFTFPGGGAYHASKHAIEAFSDALRFEVAGFGVQVVVIQPGIIKTGFADTAAANVPGADADDPYAEFNRAVLKTTLDVYRMGLLSKLGGVADDVAAVIEKAISSPRPKTRYRVTPSASLLLTGRRLTSDRMWDRLAAGSFPRPS